MQPNLTTPFRGLPDQGRRLTTSPFIQGHRLRTWCWLRNLLTLVTYNVNLFGGQGNGKRRCWYMHFNLSSLVPHPQLKLVNKFGNLNSIKLIMLEGEGRSEGLGFPKRGRRMVRLRVVGPWSQADDLILKNAVAFNWRARLHYGLWQ